MQYRASYMAAIRLYSATILKVLLLSLSILADISVSSFFSDDFSESGSLVGRSLLQQKKECPVNMESQNYTIITSQCNGPNYPPGPCCNSFKEFACPFAEVLNDGSNNCAETMFDYISTIGNYSAGLFSTQCKEGPEGLNCSAFLPPQPANNTSSGVRTTHNRYQLVMFTTSCLVPLLLIL